ncbi:uncharacterized protein LOC129909851 [Episyrphus balteatus]|uniref:uncharacterized protein LOC129909851 n=1 Tax=Episyrphus balteatus TaxID=286459 RepID=UPI002486980D|nr:uncharacterized protein LOC129909851 [Episyrphus balteatus]
MFNKRTNKRWTREETEALLKLYNERKDQFKRPRKRRLAFAEIREEMIAAGFDTNITTHHLEIKIHTLLRSFKAAKDNAKANGSSAECRTPFYDEMNEIFGDNLAEGDGGDDDSMGESFNFGAVDLDKDETDPTTMEEDPDAQEEDVTVPTNPTTSNSATVTKRWTKEETSMFLHYYNLRKNEFNRSRKKKIAFANVLEDMIAAGFDPNTKVNHLEVKMQTLLRSYKAAKKNPNLICNPLSTEPFFEQMEEIYGNFYDNKKTKPNYNESLDESESPIDYLSVPNLFPRDSIESTSNTKSEEHMSSSEYRRRRLEQKERKYKAADKYRREYMQLKKEWEEKKLELMRKIIEK